MSFEIVTLLQSIRDRGEQFDESNPDTKQALLHSARNLVAALEPTNETVLRILSNSPTLMASVSIGVNSGLFHAIVSDGGHPKSVEVLAHKTGAEALFLGRIARHLAAERLILETGVSEYAPTAATHMLTSLAMEGMTKIMVEGVARTLPTLSSFFKQNGFRDPSPRNPLQFALNTDESAFQWALRPGNEEMAQAFRIAMTVKDLSPNWHSGVPVEEILGYPNDPDSVLLVDIGGNVGNDLLSFHKAFPDLPGRLILEDLPESVAKLNENDLNPIQVLGHDFFTPQPITGARGYFLKHILHDWNDGKCREILANIKGAMTPGHSKILINEVVIPDRGASWFDASQDILMMIGHGAQERSEGAWKNLVGSVGLKVTKIWEVKGSTEKLLEVDLI